MSHTAWTGMLAPELLAALEMANGRLDWMEYKHTDAFYVMPNSSRLPLGTYTELGTSAFARNGGREYPCHLQPHSTSRPHEDSAQAHNGTCAHRHPPLH